MNRGLLPSRAAWLMLAWLTAMPAPAANATRQIGVAKIDVTPEEPIRLTGYGSRTTNSIGVAQKLWAKALAIGSDREGPALLLTLDNCGITEEIYKELVARLAKKAKLKPHQIAIACSHTHSAPCTTGWAPNIFARDIPTDQQAAIDRYTRDLLDRLEQVALAALKDRRPGALAWSQGSVGFAKNRRVVVGNTAQFGDNAGGPADHALPVLLATDADGKVRALVANYACHCTTLGGEVNHVCGDWAGFAQEAIEREHPGAVALITIGCGADANPSPRGGADGGLALARQHGEEIGAEVKRLLGQNFTPLPAKLTTKLKHIELPFGPHFTRTQWEARAKEGGINGYHAQKWLARLDRGEKLPDTLSYYVQTWTFGDDLAMVFLNGEVVVDYALRLKKEFDPTRLWVTSYANYVPCYIPSRRILAEGGYEAEGSLWYYDRPARLSTNAEDLIIKTVHGLMPKSFRADPKRADFPEPKTPQQALATFRTHADLTVELVASEPLIESPVAIDWGADGRLWVCEMYDYPSGLNPPPDRDRKYGEPLKVPAGGFKPGGRIKVLSSTKHDGHYDKATLFLDGLAFPTGVFPWRKGALICAAPDILYAEDTDGDGRADVVRTNFTGFATHNFQARVNGFTWGLDGWLHGSSGLFGGKIKSLLTGKEVDLGGRDFRIKPDTGEIEPLAGISQMGRVRDDFDNWFGNDNSTLLWHYPLPDHYLRRNPHVTYPEPRVNVAERGVRSDGRGESAFAGGSPLTPHTSHLYPASRTLERFNDPHTANRVTSACGIGLYRDTLLGAGYYGNAFICEPVHNLVTRLVLEPDGVTFAGHRAPGEERGEFLASTDNWFRPVQVRTGPDGALWVVDMYRFVIEHPRWIPSNRLAQLDVRAGADMGRIYRVYPKGATLRPICDLTKLKDAELSKALDTPNGTTRDLAHIENLHRAPNPTQYDSRDEITGLAYGREVSGGVQVQALNLLDQRKNLRPGVLKTAIENSLFRAQPAVMRLTEAYLRSTNEIILTRPLPFHVSAKPEDKFAFHFSEMLTNMPGGWSPHVRFQLALSLGEWNDPRAGLALGKLASAFPGDRWMRAAILSSAVPHAAQVFRGLNETAHAAPEKLEFASQLITSATGDAAQFKEMFLAIGGTPPDKNPAWSFGLTAALLDTLERRNETFVSYSAGADNLARLTALTLTRTFDLARKFAADGTAAEDVRAAALMLLGRPGKATGGTERDLASDIAILGDCLRPGTNQRIQRIAFDRLKRLRQPEVSALLLKDWSQRPPSQRSSILAILLSRDAWAADLLKAIEHGDVVAGEMPLPSRQSLLKHKDASLRGRAERLFASHQSSNRTDVIAKNQAAASLVGITGQGAALFERNCAQCHAFRGHGHAVGPNLAEFAGKSVQDFLVAILDPNAAIEPKSVAYNVETRDGRSLTGLVRGETASGLTLVQGGGVEEKILRSDVKEIRASSLSLMPEGLEQSLAPQDLADLIAWLKQGAPARFGSASAEQAAKARAEFRKGGMNGFAKVVKSLEELPYPSWLGRLPMPYCRQDGSRLVWQTEPVGPLTPALSPAAGAREKSGGVLAESTVTFRLAAAMGFASQPQGKFTLKLNGQPLLDFSVSLTDQSWQSADGRARLNYTVLENNAEDSNGVLLIEVSPSLLKPGQPAEFEVAGSAANSQRWFGVYRLGR